MANQRDPTTEPGPAVPVLLHRGRRRPQNRTRLGAIHRGLLAAAGLALAGGLFAGSAPIGASDGSQRGARLREQQGPGRGEDVPGARSSLQGAGEGAEREGRRGAGQDPGRPQGDRGGVYSRGDAAQAGHLYPRPATGDPTVLARYAMVDQIERRGLKDTRVLAAMARVPRHRFVPEVLRDDAHADKALAIGHGQNIYQPSLVAYMTSLLDLQPGDRVLEIGTGSGYHTAVLAELADHVYSMEIIGDLGRKAAEVLRVLGYRNVELRIGDGYKGWAEEAPFDAILLTAAPPEIPQPLIDQLATGGTMVAPVGGGPVQELQVIVKTPDGLEKQFKGPYVVPPMTRNGEREDRFVRPGGRRP